MQPSLFDVVIVGSGTAAQTLLDKLGSEAMRIALVAPEPLGGTCALSGCQPKKYLWAHHEAWHRIRSLLGNGFTSLPEQDWSALQALKEAFTSNVPGRTRHVIEKHATFFEGRARFVSPSQLQAGGHILEAKHFVLATGSRPRRSGIPGSEHLRTSDDFLSEKRLGKRLVFIGGGAIAFEFAHIAAGFGSRVTILHHDDTFLKGFDPEAVSHLIRATRNMGIEVVSNASAVEVVKGHDGFVVTTEEQRRFEADAVYEMIGRVPDLSVLEGDAGAVSHSDGGIEVNAYMQSVSNPAVYAIGDCVDCGMSNLATVADAQGRAAGHNIVEGNRHEMRYEPLARALFTVPPLAQVGMSESQAAEKGVPFHVSKGTTERWPSSRRHGETDGFYKMVVSEEGRLLGATLLRYESPEVINLCALAIAADMPVSRLKELLLAYPTATSDLKYMLG